MALDSNDLILRDKLAIDGTRLANQRTLLAYTRTGLFFIATAIGMAHLDQSGGRFGWIEWGMTGIGIVVILIGIINYILMRRKIIKPKKTTATP